MDFLPKLWQYDDVQVSGKASTFHYLLNRDIDYCCWWLFTCSFSWICSMIFIAPMNRSSFLFFSISSCNVSAFCRSISIIMSRRFSSSVISPFTCAFSRIWASRIAWHFAFRISCGQKTTSNDTYKIATVWIFKRTVTVTRNYFDSEKVKSWHPLRYCWVGYQNLGFMWCQVMKSLDFADYGWNWAIFLSSRVTFNIL